MKANRKIKKPDASSKLVLEEIIGLTVKNSNGLASNIKTGKCVYVAGCVVVVYDVNSGNQSHLMVSHRSPKPLSCVAMSQDGRFVAAGESGPQPAVLVWDSATVVLVSELRDQAYGTGCLAFSPDGKHLVSVGGYIHLWNWQTGTLVAKLKASSSCSAVSSVSFTPDANSIITAGRKHLKLWTIVSSPSIRLDMGTSQIVQGKPIGLGLQQGSSFVCLSSSIPVNDSFGKAFPVYALTESGVLCILNSAFSVTNSVSLKVEKGFAVSATSKLIACACSDGVVQVFCVKSLKSAGMLIYSTAKDLDGDCDVVGHTTLTSKDSQLEPTPPDAVACQFSTLEKLVVVYRNRCLYIWDLHDTNKPTRCCVLASHSECIWDIKNLCCAFMHDPATACVARGCSGGVSFATCSADGSIRIWDLALQPASCEDAMNGPVLNNGQVGTSRLVSAGIFERETMEAGINTQGFRSLAVSSDGKYLAAGDCKGNIHIYDLQTNDYTCLQGAHEAEILSLSFSLSRKNNVTAADVTSSHYYLASGGRDRVIHLFDAQRNFDLIGSIDDHSAAVTSVKITGDGCQVISCSADRSLVFRDVSATNSDHKILRRHHQVASHGTVYDMVVDPNTEVVVTVGQDKKINTFCVDSGKLIRSFKQDKDFGDPIKVIIDPSCSYLVCSYSNKSLCMHDFSTGEKVLQGMGHGEVVTGVIFSPDCRHIISIGGDGCIFVWKVPAPFCSRMLQRMKESSGPLSPRSLAQPSQIIFCEEDEHSSVTNALKDIEQGDSNLLGPKVLAQGTDPQETPTFKFSISRLPKWAQSKVASSKASSKIIEFQPAEQKSCSPLVGDVSASHSPEVQVHHPSGCLDSSISRFSDASPVSNNSRSHQLATETVKHSATDKCWRSIYTVCVDLLNSPDIQKIMNTKMTMPSRSQRDLEHRCEAQKENGDLDERRTEVQGRVDTGAESADSEDRDLFKQYFGSLSTSHKIQRTEAAVKKRYSAKYVVQRDYLGGAKELFGTPVHDLGLKTLPCAEETSINASSADTLLKRLAGQKIKNSEETSRNSDFIVSREPKRIKLMGEEKGYPEANEVQEKVALCKEALKSLDAAADHAVKMFSTLATKGSDREISGKSESKFYEEAAESIASIAEKVNAVAKLVHPKSADFCGTDVNIAGFEPLLGTFAENLSQRVVEILKTNLGSA